MAQESSLTQAMQSEQLNALCSFIDQIFEPSRKMAEENRTPEIEHYTIASEGDQFQVNNRIFTFTEDVDSDDGYVPVTTPEGLRLLVEVDTLKVLGVLPANSEVL